MIAGITLPLVGAGIYANGLNKNSSKNLSTGLGNVVKNQVGAPTTESTGTAMMRNM